MHITDLCFLLGFNGVECGSDIYEVNIMVLTEAKKNADVQVVLINTPNSELHIL